MTQLRKRLNNPLIVIPPLVILLWIAWQQYALAGRDLSLPARNVNLFTSYSTASPDGSIADAWELAHSGVASTAMTHGPGYATDNATTVAVSNYASGDITLTSKKIPVKPKQTYLFKGYYTTDVRFDLIAHYYYADGTDELVLVDTYQPKKDWWSTVAHALDSSDRVQAVQFIYKLGGPGKLTVDGSYLEQKNSIYIAPVNPSGTNLIPNSKLNAGEFNLPANWSTYRAGDNATIFSTEQDNKGAFLKTTVKYYKNGEAKWQHTPLPVNPHRRYQFQVQYTSDAYVKIIAEYTLANGTRKFDAVANILPAGQWTKATAPLEIPESATSLSISLVANSDATITSRDYSLINITRPGATRWKRPLASLTFDDGWRSVYINALPLLRRYDYLGTFYINPLHIETPGFMYASELATLHAAHHEIAAHGHSHKDMTTISTSALDRQLNEGKTYLANAGYPITDFATPYGKSDPEVEWFARKYFNSSRSMIRGTNTRQNFDAYNLHALFIDQDTTPEMISRSIAETKQSNGWLILVYHNIGDGLDATAPLAAQHATITTEAFARQLDQLQKSGVTVVPVATALAEVKSQ